MINNYQQGVDLIKGLHATYIDANAQIMSVSQGLGPFIMYPNEYLRAFARAEGWSGPPGAPSAASLFQDVCPSLFPALDHGALGGMRDRANGGGI